MLQETTATVSKSREERQERTTDFEMFQKEVTNRNTAGFLSVWHSLDLDTCALYVLAKFRKFRRTRAGRSHTLGRHTLP